MSNKIYHRASQGGYRFSTETARRLTAEKSLETVVGAISSIFKKIERANGNRRKCGFLAFGEVFMGETLDDLR